MLSPTQPTSALDGTRKPQLSKGVLRTQQITQMAYLMLYFMRSLALVFQRKRDHHTKPFFFANPAKGLQKTYCVCGKKITHNGLICQHEIYIR